VVGAWEIPFCDLCRHSLTLALVDGSIMHESYQTLLYTVGYHETDAESIHHGENTSELITRVGSHAGLTRE